VCPDPLYRTRVYSKHALNSCTRLRLSHHFFNSTKPASHRFSSIALPSKPNCLVSPESPWLAILVRIILSRLILTAPSKSCRYLYQLSPTTPSPTINPKSSTFSLGDASTLYPQFPTRTLFASCEETHRQGYILWQYICYCLGIYIYHRSWPGLHLHDRTYYLVISRPELCIDSFNAVYGHMPGKYVHKPFTASMGIIS
jgi:hypothetical protein